MGVQINGSEGNVIATKGTFSGDVGIGGTLTYEDVTNIDSVGLVTARSGIEIGARPGVAASISVDGNMIVSGISTFGGDVQVPDKIIHSGDTNTAIRFPAADTITAETGGSERLRIDSSGNMGLGTNSLVGNAANVYLTINGSTLGGIALKANGTTQGYLQGTSSLIRLSSDGSKPITFDTNGSERVRIDSSGYLIAKADIRLRRTASDNGALYFGDTNNNYIFGSDADDVITFATAGNERLRITSTGIVSAETSDASSFNAMLSVNNSESNSGVALIGSGSSFSEGGWAAVTDAGIIRSSANSSNGLVLQAASGDMRFYAGGSPPAERLRIHSDGRISANTTTKYGIIHSLEDEFTPNDSRWLTDASYVASGSYGGGYVLLDGSKGYSMYCAGNGNDFYIRHHSSTTAGASGGVYINDGGTSWASASDERDKENFVTISDAITKIKTLRTVTGNYTWQPDKRHAFLIAQDVQAVLPEAVSVMNKDAATEDQRLSLRYTEVIPLLVKAMQEQQEEIESLKARLDAAGL